MNRSNRKVPFGEWQRRTGSRQLAVACVPERPSGKSRRPSGLPTPPVRPPRRRRSALSNFRRPWVGRVRSPAWGGLLQSVPGGPSASGLGGAVPVCQSQDVTVSAWPDGLRSAQALRPAPEVAGDRDGFRLDQNRLPLGRLVLHGRMSLWLGVGYQAVQDPVQHASQRPGHSPDRRKARRTLGDRGGGLGSATPFRLPMTAFQQPDMPESPACLAPGTWPP